ncbi:MAG: hypothetical protein PHI70_07975 [Proteiniphilum sp.]|nr:hypothetical protein [Proteiniphilum sp.]
MNDTTSAFIYFDIDRWSGGKRFDARRNEKTFWKTIIRVRD